MCLLYEFNLRTLFHLYILFKIRLLSISLSDLILCSSPFLALLEGNSLFNFLLIRFSPSNHFIFFLLFLLIILAFCWRTGTCSYNDLWKGYVVMVVLYFHNLNIWCWRLGLLLLLMMMLLEYRGNKVDKVHRCLVLIIVLIRVKWVLGFSQWSFLIE